MSPAQIHIHLEPINVMTFGIRIFANIIKLSYGYTALRQALNLAWLLILKEEKNLDTDKQGGYQVMTEAETGVMQLQAK